MKARWAHRRHSLRVAAIATLVIMAVYVIATIVVNLFVWHHLIAATDSRLTDQLRDASQHTLSLPRTGATSDAVDVDASPLYLWSIDPSGRVTPLTPTSPPLPVRHWDSNPVTLSVGVSTLRFDTQRSGGTLLVAGQSLATTSRVRSTLLATEIVFGVIFAMAVFVGATIVGLRASAPAELIRRRQAEFTADASHELRTPISVIEAEIGLALTKQRGPAEYQEVLERVGQESSRLRQIVEDLLWLARADDEPPREGVSEVADVAEVAAACVQRFGVLAARQDVDLTMEVLGGGSCLIHGQSELIDRLVGVLVDNACKFAGIAGRVEVSVGSSGGQVVLRVDDTGPGIPPEHREAVFDRFHRASESVSGAGLGLAIADSVVRVTDGAWAIGVADLGGARIEVSWRRAAPRRAGHAQGPAPLTKSLP